MQGTRRPSLLRLYGNSVSADLVPIPPRTASLLYDAPWSSPMEQIGRFRQPDMLYVSRHRPVQHPVLAVDLAWKHGGILVVRSQD